MISNIEPLIDAREEMALRGTLPGLKIGKVWRFRASTLDEWVDEQLQSNRHPQSPKENQ